MQSGKYLLYFQRAFRNVEWHFDLFHATVYVEEKLNFI